MLQVTQAIKERGFDYLRDELKIEIREYPEHGLYKLNYSQIESPKMDPIVQECRGLLVDAEGNVVSRTFKRFFNFGEAGTENFDFSHSVVMEKCDGSLCAVYFCEATDRWEIATRGTAFAEANHAFGTKTNWTFREAILDAFGKTEEQFQEAMGRGITNNRENPGDFHQTCTYVFEYTSPYNQIVTRYEKPEMVLLAVTSNLTLHEAHLDGLRAWAQLFKNHGMNVRLFKTFDLHSVEGCQRALSELRPDEEGFVIRNGAGERIKLKSIKYVALHQLRGNGTPSAGNLYELVAKNEQDEFLAYFPLFKDLIEPIVMSRDQFIGDAEGCYYVHCGETEQKEFALKVKDRPYAALLFKARKDCTTVADAWAKMELSQKCKLIEKALEYYK
jgi:hypothetical protein